MRLGCFGCLFLILALLVVAVFAVGVIFLSANIFSAPNIRTVQFARSDGYSAQQKLYEIALRQTGRSSRRDPIVLTEPEANAFLSRHLDQAGLPLSPIVVKFSAGQMVVQGQTVLRNLIKGPPLAQLLPYVTEKRLDQPVWLTVRGGITIDGAGDTRYASLDVSDFALGTQHLGSFLLWALLGPSGGGVLQWQVPASVERVQIGDGQLTITTR